MAELLAKNLGGYFFWPTLYTADLCPLLVSHGLLHHLFADYVQAYIHTRSADAVTTVSQMCLTIDLLDGIQSASLKLLENAAYLVGW